MHTWEELPASVWVRRVIVSGFSLLWGDRRPGLSAFPPAFRAPAVPEKEHALAQEVTSLLEKGAIEEVEPSSPGFYARLFVVPKANGSWRPVLDLSPLNRYLRRMPFRMSTPRSVRLALRPGDWTTSIDLKDAYFHVKMHRSSRKWMRFVWGDRVYQFRALPFGLSLSPWVFTRVVLELVKALHAQGVRIVTYLDDWLIMNQTRQGCGKDTQRTLTLAHRMGFVTNLEKSDLSPTQSFLFLGMRFDTVQWSVAPAQQRIDILIASLTELRVSAVASARQLSSLLGRMESLADIVPLGRARKRPLQRELAARFSPQVQDWSSLIPLGDWFREATDQWLDRSWLGTGVPISSQSQPQEVFTDASHSGWGAHFQQFHASGLWTGEQTGWHINRLELQAVIQALEEFWPLLRQDQVRVVSDNTTVVAYINRQGGTQSHSLSMMVEGLLEKCMAVGVTLSARHLAGSSNILADVLSRSGQVLNTEWTISHSALERIWGVWDKPLIDLFATKFSKRLPMYVSPVPDPEAWAVDALSISWKGLQAYAFPPTCLLSRVINKVREDCPSLILVAPWWESQVWFPDLLELAHGPPIDLRIRPGELLQPRSGVPHGNPSMFALHAWKL